MNRPTPTRPDLTPVFRDGCACAADGTRNDHCPITNHRAEDDDDA